MTAGKRDTEVTYVALIRGINVGPSKRLAMADLRAAVLDLGFHDVRTVLNSGNLIFTASGVTATDAASRIESVLAGPLGVPANVVVLSAEDFALAARENPLAAVADDPSRMLVAFLADSAEMSRLTPLAGQDWTPEALAVVSRVAYLWCPDGVIASRLAQAVARALGHGVTMRNWTTVGKVRTLVDKGR
jgi:uncharacterized protein (DUF1697 family)